LIICSHSDLACVSYAELLKNTDAIELPDVLVRFWQPVLYLLNNLQLTPSLLNHLASQLSEASGLRDRIISGWIATIMSAVENYGKNSLFCW
jgi:hypothetical protein